jgi:hypothetical protein
LLASVNQAVWTSGAKYLDSSVAGVLGWQEMKVTRAGLVDAESLAHALGFQLDARACDITEAGGASAGVGIVARVGIGIESVGLWQGSLGPLSVQSGVDRSRTSRRHHCCDGLIALSGRGLDAKNWQLFIDVGEFLRL